jgi:hypothetical protein
MNAMNLSACRPASGVIASSHDDGLVLMHLAHGRLFTANRCGARIWRALEARHSPQAIATALSRDYAIPLDVAARHTERFIADLAAHVLLDLGDER